MRILFVASLHHPEALQATVAAAPPGSELPLFPPSMGQHLWDKALRKRGHVTDVFYRNLPLFGTHQAERHSERLTPAKVLSGLMRRVPAEANLDFRVRNRHLLQKVQAFKPDVLWMVGDNRVIYPATLATIKRETGCKIVYSTGISPIVFSGSIERRAAPLYDLVISNDYYHGIQWLELGAKKMECLPGSACDPDFHHTYTLTDSERKEYSCDIAFVGTLVPDNLYSRRVQALEALRDFDLGIWSVHDVPASLKGNFRGYALGEDTLEVFSAARMTINIHGDFMRYGGNMRLFEAAGVGVFQIADDLPGVHQWFSEGETIVTFHDMDDLREKVAYYLSHDDERLAIAHRAQEHVYQKHTYDQRVLHLEELLLAL